MAKLRDWLSRHRDAFVRAAHRLEVLTLIALMVGGGGGTGYALCQWQYRELMAQQREDHLAEIGRLQGAYTHTLSILAPQVTEAAGVAAQAAEASVEAAKSVKRATRAAPPPQVLLNRPLTEAERDLVNREIEAANRRVKEGKR